MSATSLNRILSIYTDLDSWFDYRRGLLQHLLTAKEIYLTDDARKKDGDTKWETYYAAQYKERRLDDFKKNEVGITNALFEQTFSARTISHFISYYPTNLGKSMLRMIMDIEMVDNPTPSIKGCILYVNVYPYVLDQELELLLVDSLNRRLKGVYDIRLINSNPYNFTAKHFSQYNYVFKYDLLLGNYKTLMDTLPNCPIPDTCMIVPALFKTINPGIMGTPEDMLYALATTLTPVVKLVPCNPSVYDYDPSTA